MKLYKYVLHDSVKDHVEIILSFNQFQFLCDKKIKNQYDYGEDWT